MSTIIPTPSSDARRRDDPFESEEDRQHAERAIRALEAIDEMGSEEEQKATYAALVAAMEETRRLSYPHTEE